MTKKSQDDEKKTITISTNTFIKNAGEVEIQPIEKTLEMNYMPYAMSVILSRALPQIDGFKPSHRKLLYTMFKMGLLKGKLTKSANVVGATMKLNPHGDSAIYDTMVRMSRGYGALLHPYVESKGNFGKFFSRDMDCAASRYTEVKLAPICEELFDEIECDSVDFVNNYDGTTVEPVLLPVKFPSILVNSNVGIAVSMASSICPFNLVEVCKTAIKIVKDQPFNLIDTLKGPDFPGGGLVINDRNEFEKIYQTGRGSFQIRSVFSYDKKNNCVEVTEIPYTTTAEAIIEKIVALIKIGKLKEISDVRDETDLKGLKIAIDLKRGTNFNEVVAKLLKLTPLQDSYSCNFNVLVNLTPNVMGVRQIIKNWQKFRQQCVKRKLQFDLNKKEKRLHLIEGLNKILVDIDRAIEIIRNTQKEADVVVNLMEGFEIDVAQAEYICEIKLRNLNKQHILNKIEEKQNLANEIQKLRKIVNSEYEINNLICQELNHIAKKYGVERKTKLIEIDENEFNLEEKNELFEFKVVLTKKGYLKKIDASIFKPNQPQKLKEGDSVCCVFNLNSFSNLLFFTNKTQVYFSNLNLFENLKSTSLGEFIAAKLKFDKNEELLKVITTENYSENLLFFFENGKVAKIKLSSFKTTRKKLSSAFCSDSDLCKLYVLNSSSDENFVLISSDGRWLIVNSHQINLKTTRNCKGIKIMKLRLGQTVVDVKKLSDINLTSIDKFTSKSFPASGKQPTMEEIGKQLKL